MSDKINILLLGNGGREHALAWAINKSSLTEKLLLPLETRGRRNVALMFRT